MGGIEMSKKSAKLWAHCEEVKFIIGLYIILIFAVLFFSLCFSLLAYSEDIDAGVQDALKIAILNGMKWYTIIMPIITALFIVWFFIALIEFSLSIQGWNITDGCLQRNSGVLLPMMLRNVFYVPDHGKINGSVEAEGRSYCFMGQILL